MPRPESHSRIGHPGYWRLHLSPRGFSQTDPNHDMQLFATMQYEWTRLWFWGRIPAKPKLISQAAKMLSVSLGGLIGLFCMIGPIESSVVQESFKPKRPIVWHYLWGCGSSCPSNSSKDRYVKQLVVRFKPITDKCEPKKESVLTT